MLLLYHTFPPWSDQFSCDIAPAISSIAEITGRAPEPYAEKTMGDPDDPEEGGRRISFHTPPRLNCIQSPDWNDEPFTFETVCHALDGDLPSFESDPVGST
jgi:hypothetical protein